MLSKTSCADEAQLKKKNTQKEWSGVGGGLVGVWGGERKRKLACIQQCVRPHTI